MENLISRLLRRRKRSAQAVTAFPAGTVVEFNGIPCELISTTPYRSATFRKQRG